MDLEIAQEVVVETKKPKRKRKIINSKVLKGLLICLFANEHSHMLKWTDYENKHFEVKLVNKKSSKWKPGDVSLFRHLDSLAKKVRSKNNYEEKSKNRFKSNILKFQKAGYIKELKPARKISKCITIKTFEILKFPECVEIEKLMRNEDEVKRNSALMENCQMRNLGIIGGNQNYLNFGNNKEVMSGTMMELESGESKNLGAIGGNQNNISFEKNNKDFTNGTMMELESDESRNLGVIGGNQNNISFEKNNKGFTNGPIMENDESSHLGAIEENLNNSSYEKNEIIGIFNNMGRNDVTLRNFEDPINPFNTSAVDLNTLNNVFPTSQMNTDYSSLNLHVGDFFFSKDDDNVKNTKENNAVILRTKEDPIPFNTFAEDFNIQNVSETFEIDTDYSSPCEEIFFSRDYEGNKIIKFESENRENVCLKDIFQLPAFESDSSKKYGLPGFNEIRGNSHWYKL